MTDEGAKMIARAIRFVGLCLINAVVFTKCGGREIAAHAQQLIDQAAKGAQEL